MNKPVTSDSSNSQVFGNQNTSDTFKLAMGKPPKDPRKTSKKESQYNSKVTGTQAGWDIRSYIRNNKNPSVTDVARDIKRNMRQPEKVRTAYTKSLLYDVKSYLSPKGQAILRAGMAMAAKDNVTRKNLAGAINTLYKKKEISAKELAYLTDGMMHSSLKGKFDIRTINKGVNSILKETGNVDLITDVSKALIARGKDLQRYSLSSDYIASEHSNNWRDPDYKKFKQSAVDETLHNASELDKTAKQLHSDKMKAIKSVEYGKPIKFSDADKQAIINADRFAVGLSSSKTNPETQFNNMQKARKVLESYQGLTKHVLLSGKKSVNYAKLLDVAIPTVAVVGVTPGDASKAAGWKQGSFNLISLTKDPAGQRTVTNFLSEPMTAKTIGIDKFLTGPVLSYSWKTGKKIPDLKNLEVGYGQSYVMVSKDKEPMALQWLNVRAVTDNKPDPDLGGVPSGGRYVSLNFGLAFNPAFLTRKGLELGKLIPRRTPQSALISTAMDVTAKGLKKSKNILSPWAGVGWRAVLDKKTGKIYVRGKEVSKQALQNELSTFLNKHAGSNLSTTRATTNEGLKTPGRISLASSYSSEHFYPLEKKDKYKFLDRIGLTREVFQNISVSQAAQGGEKLYDVMKEFSGKLSVVLDNYNKAREAGHDHYQALQYSQWQDAGLPWKVKQPEPTQK